MQQFVIVHHLARGCDGFLNSVTSPPHLPLPQQHKQSMHQ